jgi:hypothetical protein
MVIHGIMKPLPMIFCACVALDHIVTTEPLVNSAIVVAFIISLVTMVTMLPVLMSLVVSLYACYNSRMTGQTFMEFGMDIVPLLSNLKFYFIISFRC